MKKILNYCSIVIIIYALDFPRKSHSAENNVCKTIQDYYTIKNNNNCEYDVAADPDSDPTTIIRFYGYPVEIHEVTTSDGYILTMFRIPNNNQVGFEKGPVFLQHGWMASCSSYLGLGRNSLAFVLADAGYDVWLGNFRGTEYSEGHVNLTVYDKEYWDYSIDDIGLYDLPAQLDYISQKTGNKGNIVYIGHSLGTNLGLIYTSTFPEQARKTLKLLILLAPGAHQSNVKAPLFKYLRNFAKPLLEIINDKNLIRLVSQGKSLRSLNRKLCFASPFLLQRCANTFGLLLAGPQGQMDPKTIPVSFNQIPAGASFKILAQIVDFTMNNFRRYDYGVKNFEKYGSNEPPSYDLTKIEVPIFLAYAINDWAITPKDTLQLYNNLPPRVRYGKYEITVPNFNHIDFLYGRNAKSIVYDVILQVLSLE